MNPTTRERARRWGRNAATVALWIWAPACILLIACLMVQHWVVLPTPESKDPAVQQALARLRDERTRDRWQAVHVLYAECACSRKIVDHLLERGAIADVAETIVLVGEPSDLESQATAKGYAIDVVTPDELVQKYGFQSVPMLAVTDPRGTVLYVGGYTSRKQGPDIRDAAIIQALQRQEQTAALPLFGCAVSDALKQILDPLNLKYATNAR
jgi:hypothetical protein